MSTVYGGNEPICCEDRSTETARDILLILESILMEIKNQVDLIDSAIYGKGLEEATTIANKEPSMPPMLTLLSLQRDSAEDILKRIMHIREGLW